LKQLFHWENEVKMDYRERRYYLVRFNDGSGFEWWSKNHDDFGRKFSNYCNMLKGKIPSIKIHKPYNHFKSNNKKKDNYDGEIKEIGYVQLMISCRKEYYESFKKIISEIKEQDNYVVCKEITREVCEQ